MNKTSVGTLIAIAVLCFVVIGVIAFNEESATKPVDVVGTTGAIEDTDTKVKEVIAETQALDTQNSVPASSTEPVASTTPGLNTDQTLLIAIVVLSLALIISVSITFYLYKWRKVLLTNKHMAVPEEWAKYLQSLEGSLKKFTNIVGDGLGKVAKETNTNSENISKMTGTYMELQSALDEKDREIKRLKDGYDAEIFKRFIARFVRIEQAIDDFMMDSNEETEQLRMLKLLFEDALSECGVAKFEPQLGGDYRNEQGVSDNPKFEKTDDPEEAYQICEVIEPGYRLVTGESNSIIIPSKVRIYKHG